MKYGYTIYSLKTHGMVIMQTTSKDFYTRARNIVSGLLIGAILPLLLYVFMVRDQWKKINNFYLKTAYAIGMAVLGITISPVMMLIFGYYGARLGAEMGAEKYFNLVKALLNPTPDKKPALSKEAQSSTELAFLLPRVQTSSSSPAASAKVVALPASGHSLGMFAQNIRGITRRSSPEHRVDIHGLKV
jgi:hypothetical protein